MKNLRSSAPICGKKTPAKKSAPVPATVQPAAPAVARSMGQSPQAVNTVLTEKKGSRVSGPVSGAETPDARRHPRPSTPNPWETLKFRPWIRDVVHAPLTELEKLGLAEKPRLKHREAWAAYRPEGDFRERDFQSFGHALAAQRGLRGMCQATKYLQTRVAAGDATITRRAGLPALYRKLK